MKRKTYLLAIIVAAFTITISASCKNKTTESTTQENMKKEESNSVEISSDVTLRSAVNDLLKAYEGVKAEVKDGVVTLRGNIKRTDFDVLIPKIHDLKPKKVENQLVIET